MGYYINPTDQSKEAWLEANHIPETHTTAPRYDSKPEGSHWVCLVDNGAFTAAGIAFDRDEFEAFRYPDNRTKLWLAVADTKLIEVCPHVEGVLK